MGRRSGRRRPAAARRRSPRRAGAEGGLLILLLASFAGVLLWSFLEYALHRFDGHGMRGRTRFSREHLAHHADPRTFAPTRFKVAAAVPVVGLLAAIAIPAFGTAGAVFVGSFTATYIAYEVLHRRIHTHAPRGPYGRWARRHHLAHHFLAPDGNHGVTTPLWDAVFGTWIRPDGAVRIPRKRAPVWLLDPATGEVRPSLQEDYFVPKGARRTA